MSASIAENILGELRELVVRYQTGEDTSRIRMDLDRWKRRAVTTLTRIVPNEELAPFLRMSTEPHWARADEGQDPFNPVLSSHDTYLESLVVDMRSHPDSYGEAVLRDAPATRTAAAPNSGEPLPLPERVTLSWLLDHVPVTLWIAFFGILLAAFVLGATIGMIPDVARWLAPLVGVDLPAPSGP